MARVVELFIDGNWVDVTADPGYVLTEDVITITRGVDAQSTLASPGSCSLTLFDRDKDGRWSNRVPTSTYWGKLGRNTPIRITVDGDVRFVGEVPEWEPRWELGDRKVRTPISAAGILRRLTEGARSLASPLSRAVLSAANTTPREYWKLNDGSNATQLASSVPGRKPMTLSGSTLPALGTVTGPDGDQGAFPEFISGGAYAGSAIADELDLTGATSWTVEFWFRATKTSVANAQVVMASWHTDSGSYAAQDWLVYAARVGASEGVVLVVDHSPTAATSFSYSGSSVSMMDGEWHQVRVTAIQNSGSVTVEFWVDGVLRDSDPLNVTRPTIGNPKDAQLGDPGVSITGAYPLSNTASLSMSHWQMYATNVATDHYDAGTGYDGEVAGRRAERLCGEEGIAFTGVGDLDNTVAMGPQTTDTLVNLLQTCALADQGMLYETRTELGLSYRTRVSIYNQYGPLLDYSAGHIAPDMEPSESITFVHNYVTVKRPNGSSATAVLDEPYLNHTLTTQAPPDGVGTYDRGEVEANVETDDQLDDLAYWLRHQGTWDELRYPSLSIELAADVWDSDPTLADELTALDSGDQLRLDGLPAWLPPDQVALLVRGSVEIIGTHTRSLTWNLTPGWPWEVWELDSGASTLVAAVDDNDTSLKIATSRGPEWSTTAEPYHIQIDGEAMTVTAMTTDTPAFIAAGTVAHAVNASVTPGLPAGMTPDVGQALLVWVAIRNSGTGTPNTPSGYTKLVDCANAVLFGKYYVTGDAAPTITFAGGVANADTSARMFGFSGMSLEYDDGDYNATAVSPQTQLNGSAQNVSYPALSVRRDNGVVLYLFWKQDDATGYATVGDAEIIDNSTTTGDDQSIAADYDIQTTATDVTASSVTVTGGASAISRAGVVAFRPLQTATVTRAVNGVSKSIAAAKAVHGWRMGVVAL